MLSEPRQLIVQVTICQIPRKETDPWIRPDPQSGREPGDRAPEVLFTSPDLVAGSKRSRASSRPSEPPRK